MVVRKIINKQIGLYKPKNKYKRLKTQKNYVTKINY